MSGWPELRESRTVQAGTAPGTVVRCGLMDLMMADLAVPVVFFYDRPLDDARLAEGLATALAAVPVFAGRLRTGEDGAPRIVCDDSGVPMTTYDVDETLAEAIGRVTLTNSGYVDHLDAPAARQGEQPLLSVRVSRLSDGGTVLGCSWHHAVGDMRSFMLLLRAWSAAVEGTEPPEAQVLADPDEYLDRALPAEDSGRPGFWLPGEEEVAALMREIEVATRANRSVQVYFGPDEVDRMRASLTAAAGRRLSTNDVLCAHIVSTIRLLDEDQEGRALAMPVDVRRYLDLPAAVVGNLVSEIYLSCAPKSAPETVAAEIRAAVDDFPRAHLNLRANHAFLAAIGRDRLGECMPIGFNPAQRTFTIANWSRFGVYDIAFGGHRPAAFSPAANLQLPWVSTLVEGFGGVGYFLAVALPTRLAGKLRGPDGMAAMHRYRHPDDPLPTLATEVRKLA